ncbi:MAG: prolipoprotein diacylglyceryl transferase [Pseudomonadota bacterium]
MGGPIFFPDISPEIFVVSLGGFEFALRWYALSYIVGILIAWWLIARALNEAHLWQRERPPVGPAAFEEFVTWAVVGIILGGRLGFVIFYQPGHYFANPLDVLKIWQGGMAFHGGFLGVVIAGLLWCRRRGVAILPFADLLAYATPPALLLVRGANFINAELWGRPTDLPWGVVFPGATAQECPGPTGVASGFCARHPSQLYEAALEGLLLGIVLIYLAWRRGLFHRAGAALGIFLAGYGLARFLVEFVRQPDAQFVSSNNPIGHALVIAPGYGLTMGQLLSLPMLVLGLWFLLKAYGEVRRV